MANALPTRWHGRPKGFYSDKEEPQTEGTVSLKRPANPTRIERVSCACGNRFKLSDVQPSVVCDCGQTVTLKEKL